LLGNVHDHRPGAVSAGAIVALACWGGLFVAMFRNQLKQVLRRLGCAPLFTTITLLTVAIGDGANTVIFSVVAGFLFSNRETVICRLRNRPAKLVDEPWHFLIDQVWPGKHNVMCDSRAVRHPPIRCRFRSQTGTSPSKWKVPTKNQ
jgi:hypothetical protein